MRIAFLVFPGVLQLDCTGPYGVFAAGPQATVDLVWKDKQPVHSSDGLIFTPTATIDDNTAWDIVCVPGGSGILALLEDNAILKFLQQQAATAQFMVSVCTGSLVLGAAGLLQGYRATTHWQAMDMLPLFQATPINARVVTDRNRVTAAGVSAGIDMALTLAAALWGSDSAQEIQLNMQYSPEPPFTAGSPATAPAHIVTALQQKAEARQALRLAAAKRAAQALTLTK